MRGGGDVGGRREIRLARAEVDEIDPFALQFLGRDRPLHRRRHADVLNPFGQSGR